MAATIVERAIRLYEQEREGREGSSALGMYVRRWTGWAIGGVRAPTSRIDVPAAHGALGSALGRAAAPEEEQSCQTNGQ